MVVSLVLLLRVWFIFLQLVALTAANLPQPDKKIPYPIAHDAEGGSLFVYCSLGPFDGAFKKVVLFCPGFPDDHEAFMPLAFRLAKERNFLVGVMCLPGFDDRPEKPWKGHWKDGYTLDEMIEAFQNGAGTLLVEARNGMGERQTIDYTVIIHDWAVPVGMMQINRASEMEQISRPEISMVPNRVVIMDVGLPFHPKDQDKPKLRSFLWPNKRTTVREAVSELSYRIGLSSMFFLQRYLPSIFAYMFFVLCMSLMDFTQLGPAFEIDLQYIRRQNVRRLAYMSYGYYRLGIDLLAFGLLNGDSKRIEQEATLPVLDSMDVLYMYGREKRIMFHDKNLVEFLNDFSRNGGRSRAVQIEGGGHWFHLQEPERTFQEICTFLESNCVD